MFEIKRYHILIALSGALLVWEAAHVWFGNEEPPVPPVVKDIAMIQKQSNPQANPLPVNSVILDVKKLKKVPLMLTLRQAQDESLSKHEQIALRNALPFLPLPQKWEGSVKTIALTFDDGPHPVYTEKLLKILKDYDVPATFFVVGKQASMHPELIQKIFEDGHELANHTYSHRDMRTLNAEEFESELDKTYEIVEGITDQKMRFFRPPGGQYNQTVINRGRDLGYEMVLWTALAKDYANPPAQVILNRVLRSAGDRGVILLHSGVKNTLAILPELIQDLRKEGFMFQTLSQMEQSSGQKQLTAFNKNPRVQAQ